MATLHALRRSHNLSLSELARLTGIPARRLAEYEYEQRPLRPDEREAVAAVFGVRAHSVAAGLAATLEAPANGRLQPRQAYLLSALAATAALSLSLRAARPDLRFNSPISLAAPIAAVARTPTPPPTPAPLAPEGNPAARRTLGVSPTALATMAEETEKTEAPGPAQPHRCPVVPQHGTVVVTQGYGVGTHTPTNVNGAVDLAVDGDGNGLAETGTTWGSTIVAAHAGVVEVALNTWPAGNQIWVDGGDGWRSGYSHLATVYVRSGERVAAGQPLGLIGNTGYAAGPHLDIQVWRSGRNVDPTDLLRCR